MSLVLPNKKTSVIVLDDEGEIEQVEEAPNIIAKSAYLSGITNSLDGLNESSAQTTAAGGYSIKKNYTPISFEEISPERKPDTVQPSQLQTGNSCEQSEDVVYVRSSPQPLGMAISGLRNFSSTLFSRNVQSELL